MTKLIENLKASIFVSTLTKIYQCIADLTRLNLGVSMAVCCLFFITEIGLVEIEVLRFPPIRF